MNVHELSRAIESRDGPWWEKVTQLTRKGFKEECIDLRPQLGRINTPHFMFLIIRSTNER